jgi:hypothetical protein
MDAEEPKESKEEAPSGASHEAIIKRVYYDVKLALGPLPRHLRKLKSLPYQLPARR